MEVIDLTYTELRIQLAQRLGRSDIPSATLSRWMTELGYPKGSPGKKRDWNGEDLVFIGFYASALGLYRCSERAKRYAKNQLLKVRTHACQ
ncbi:MAG: hypothetical protein AAF528_04110 [Cyanobacteria bacterium P01_C01_bin.121]